MARKPNSRKPRSNSKRTARRGAKGATRSATKPKAVTKIAVTARGAKKCRILISNDDGIHAPGIKVLTRIAKTISDDVWVVAPEVEQSGASHSLTVRTPVRIRKIGDRRYSVGGTPTDCVLLGALQILKDHPPDLVLSGVNGGGNLAEDVQHSGTVAAATMGASLGFPAIAFSQHFVMGSPLDFSAALQYGPELIRKLMAAPWRRDTVVNTVVNINFPDRPAKAITGISVTRQGRRRIKEHITEAVDPFGRPYYWIGAPRKEQELRKDSDISAVMRGEIAVTPLDLDLTHTGMLRSLRKLFPEA
jgi:5'-nucleotidase